MSTFTRWVVPCYFTEEKYQTDPIEFDLTEHLKLILSNEVWNRKFDFGYGQALKNIDPKEITNAKILVFPRFISGYVNKNRIQQLIDKYCDIISGQTACDSYKNWSHQIGFAIIEIQYSFEIDNFPIYDETDEFPPKYDRQFITYYHQNKAALEELAFFFLAALHLSFPSSSIMLPDENPLIDGFYQLMSNGKMHLRRKGSNAFMHQVLIETSKISNVHSNLKGLASVWHYNLWPLQRFLKAIESDQLTMDNLLDLLYSLEGLFRKSTSSEMIKTMCIVTLCSTKKEAKRIKEVLDTSYKIRNDIVHGERSYDSNDPIKIGGEGTIAEIVFWELKVIVARMLIKAISKLMKDSQLRNLCFNEDDFINSIFKN